MSLKYYYHSQLKKYGKSTKFSYLIYRLLLIIISILSIRHMWTLYTERSIDKVSVVKVVELPPQSQNSNSEYRNWKDEWYCRVQCKWGHPCEYKDEVDFRIIVMTYNRHHSLRKCLESIGKIETLSDKVSIEIWIDRSNEGIIDPLTEGVARKFQSYWMNSTSKGRVCVHLQEKNAYINKQWIDTWRPKIGTNELALILEDDISISPWSYKWIKNTYSYFKGDNNIAGYTLQMEDVAFFAPNIRTPMYADPEHNVFLYPALGTWGYAPHPVSWRKYQDWLYTVRPNFNIATDLITPNVPGILPNIWYNRDLKLNTHEAMHEMWHIKFTHDYKLFTVYSNLMSVTGRKDVLLSTNRKEEGLHFTGDSLHDYSACLLHEWKDEYAKYPRKSDLILYNYDGSVCSSDCCFSTTCYSVPFSFFRNIWLQTYHYVMKPLRKFRALFDQACE